MQPQRALLPDGRWHFQHGPIDLIIGAEGEPEAVEAAHVAAWARFQNVLPELAAELRALRQPVRGPCALQSRVARRMWHACRPFHSGFITPMAAVAGSVAQELVASYERAGIVRAWVNNGGDIALHLADGASVKVGLFADLANVTDLARFDPATNALQIDADFRVTADLPVRGIATSGWRGRSFSLGIADSVTVLARTAAMADAAATILANAVDLDDARIERRPANELKDDSDLGDMRVTVNVPPLPAEQVRAALQTGARRARAMQREGLIHSAVLVCQHHAASVEPEAHSGPAPAPCALAVGSVFA